MEIKGIIKKIIYPKVIIPYDGFITITEGDKFDKLKDLFQNLPRFYSVYIYNNIVFEVEYCDTIYYIGYSDKTISIGLHYNKLDPTVKVKTKETNIIIG